MSVLTNSTDLSAFNQFWSGHARHKRANFLTAGRWAKARPNLLFLELYKLDLPMTTRVVKTSPLESFCVILWAFVTPTSAEGLDEIGVDSSKK